MHRPHIGDSTTERVLFIIYLVLTLLSILRFGTIDLGLHDIAIRSLIAQMMY